MTGFGSAEKAGCRVEIRSLNQRFLDIYIKAPSFLNQHEMTFRAILKDRFSRGKLDVSISMTGEAAAEPKVNREAAGRIYRALRSLQQDFSIPGEVDIRGMAYFHDMFMETDSSYDLEEIRGIFVEAVEGLYSMRNREGQLLVGELDGLIDSLGRMNAEMRELCAKAAPEAGRKLQDKIRVLLEGRDIDPARLHQEIAVLAAKFDISEEIARLDCHIQQFREVLSRDDIIGRKLDFLVQELNREANTMSSKSVDYGISRLTVDMKTVIEKIREQVQNLQ
jgi:uncharacterized protein (TIGR00255 family)